MFNRAHNDQAPVVFVESNLVGSQPFQNFVCGRVPWLYQYWPGGFMLFVVLCPGTREGSTGSGSGFKASQKRGQRLKSHPTDRIYFLWPCSLAVPVLAGWVSLSVVLCPGTPKGSTGSVSGFKASQKTGQRLKVSSYRQTKKFGKPSSRIF